MEDVISRSPFCPNLLDWLDRDLKLSVHAHIALLSSIEDRSVVLVNNYYKFELFGLDSLGLISTAAGCRQRKKE